MDVKELRIDNLVFDKGTTDLVEIFQLDTDSDNNDRINYVSISGYEPIPLTEEWLLKFGFEKLKDGGLSLRLGTLETDYCLDYDESTGLYLVPFNDRMNGVGLSRTDSVHQLQNLYHSLTGEELTIKEAVTE